MIVPKKQWGDKQEQGRALGDRGKRTSWGERTTMRRITRPGRKKKWERWKKEKMGVKITGVKDWRKKEKERRKGQKNPNRLKKKKDSQRCNAKGKWRLTFLTL